MEPNDVMGHCPSNDLTISSNLKYTETPKCGTVLAPFIYIVFIYLFI